MGTPFGRKYILYSYMEPLGPTAGTMNHKYYYDFAIVVATISTVSFGMTLTMTILALRVYIILSKHRSAATYAGCANPESPGIKP